AAQTANTTALTANTGALTANTGALVAATGAEGALAGAIGTLAGMETALIAAMMELSAAIDANTIAQYATAFFQTGGVVSGSGGVKAVIHAGETVASAEIMHNVGAGLAAAGALQVPDMRSTTAALQGIGDQLSTASAAGETHVHIEGNTFHGVPDQRYVN